VTKVNPRAATVKIVCVDDVPLGNDFPGLIRQLDVRQTQVDEVEIYKCFRPGDIVRAEVVSSSLSIFVSNFSFTIVRSHWETRSRIT
jgi:exosome complex RNA-binding protein Csl4